MSDQGNDQRLPAGVARAFTEPNAFLGELHDLQAYGRVLPHQRDVNAVDEPQPQPAQA